MYQKLERWYTSKSKVTTWTVLDSILLISCIEHRASCFETGAISSAVERILHTDEATGSRPVSPTNDLDKIVDIKTESLGTRGFLDIVKLWGFTTKQLDTH